MLPSYHGNNHLLYLNLLIRYFVFPVPGPPSNVTVVSDSQHSIMVFMAEPLPLMRNGIILGYAVFYRETNLLPDAGYLSVNTTASSVTLANLTVFTEYSVKVAAYTSAGRGDTSEVKTIVSQEGGTLFVCCLIYSLIHCKCLYSFYCIWSKPWIGSVFIDCSQPFYYQKKNKQKQREKRARARSTKGRRGEGWS